MKKILVVLILFLVTGCWNYQELSNYAIVTGMAVDYVDGQYEISLLISNGKKKDETNTIISLISGKGNSIYQAFKEIGLISPKELYISHMTIVVVSEDYAKQGVTSLLDFLLRDSRSHQSFFIAIAKECKAKEVLSILSPLADYPSQDISENISSAKESQGEIVNSGFIDFVKSYLEPGIHPIANSLIIIGNAKDGIIPEKQESSIAAAQTSLDSVGIFKKDKLVGWTTIEESIGIKYIINNISTSYIESKCEDGYIISTIDSYGAKYDVKKDRIVVNVEAKGNINEVNCKMDITSKKEISKLEKDVAKNIKEYMNKALMRARELKADIFGFGSMIYKKYPEYFNKINDWDEEFLKLKVEFNVEFKYHSEGTIEQNLEDFKI